MELPQIGPVVVITPLPITATLRQQLQSWLQEDLGRGDLSAAALKGCRGQAHWIAKANGVFWKKPRMKETRFWKGIDSYPSWAPISTNFSWSGLPV